MIRRPMMYIASLFGMATIAAHCFGIWAALAPAAAFTALWIIKDRTGKAASLAAMMLVSYTAGVMSYAAEQNRQNPFEDYYNRGVSVMCSISQTEYRKVNDTWGNAAGCIQIKGYVRSVEGIPVDGREKILIKYYLRSDENSPDESDASEGTEGTEGSQERGSSATGAAGAVPGRIIEIEGTPVKPEGRRNPGCFDYSLYLHSTGIRTVINADRLQLCTEDGRSQAEIFCGNMQAGIYEAREMFLRKLEASAGRQTSGFMRAIMFGEKNRLDEEILEEFRENGTAHVLAVSGLHIGIIYGFICMLWRWKKGRLFFALTVIFFLVYMVMAAFSPSVVRAVIMVWLHIFSGLANRRYDMASGAFFTGLVMLLDNPMRIFNAGFQMSFLAVLTLSLIVPIVGKIYRGMFMAGIAIQLGLYPYIAYTFNYVSLAAVFVNVPIIFLTGIIVPLGMCGMVMMCISDTVFELMSKMLYGLCTVMTKLNDMTCISGVTAFDVKSPDLWVVALYYLFLLCFISEEGRLLFLRKRKKMLFYLALLAVSASVAFGLAAGNHFKKADVVFVDVGQGDCIHLRAGRNGNYLIDGGGSLGYEVGSKTLKPYLLKNGADCIDGAFVTHLHTDHYKGIAELCREGMVKRLYVYEGYRAMEDEITADTGMESTDITYLYAGRKVILGNDASVEVMWPQRRSRQEYDKLAEDAEDENSLSLIMDITTEGKSVLITGDVDSRCLDSLAEEYGGDLDTDILKAAHHGSRYSDSAAFAEAADPEYAVFQVGKNNFGHPDKGVVEKFRQSGIII